MQAPLHPAPNCGTKEQKENDSRKAGLAEGSIGQGEADRRLGKSEPCPNLKDERANVGVSTGSASLMGGACASGGPVE